jgi:hypothetical protein
MSECGWLSDRMPAVVLGRAEWTQQEMQHLNQCGLCQQEWKLVRAAHRLGYDAGERLDPSSLADSVLARLANAREAQRQQRKVWTFGGMAAAAAVLVALWTGAPNQPGHSTPPSSLAAGQLEIPLPELESLQPAELDSVLQTMDEPNARTTNAEDPDLGDLNTEELQHVLDSWEG